MGAGRELLDWYDRSRRDLPWRRTSDPWAVWVSEIMLQQTRVETAVPFFERFLLRFPDPGALARASEEEALAAWSGLGYYRRVRQLRAAAAAVAAVGGLPRSAAELERLPGVGPYTAAAIASIAFGEPVPVLDGNVARVLARRLGLAEDPARPAVRRRLLAAAAELLEPARPGDSNQALMELGATLCLPRRPRCGDCPLAPGCAVAGTGAWAEIPPPRRRPEARAERHSAALVRGAEGSVLLARRGAESEVLPGLWELPTVEAATPPAAEFERRFGGRWWFEPEPVATLRHTITFRRIALAAYPARWEPAELAEPGAAPALRWAGAGTARELALTGATRKLLSRLAP